MIKYIKKDVLEAPAKIIVHQTNCQGVMGAGLAKCVRTKYPRVYNEYYKLCKTHTPKALLGHIQIVPPICNLFGQLNYGRNTVQTDYTAVLNAFRELYVYCKKYNVPSIALPYNMGCALGGGDWNTYVAIIRKFDTAMSEINPAFVTYICKL